LSKANGFLARGTFRVRCRGRRHACWRRDNGFRRGIIQTGAQNLLITLWPISDETTVQIMLDFYDAAFRTGNAPQALADTQRD
jgi:hypothetical protein